MRFVLYNIRYGTGVRAVDIMRPSARNLERITEFLRKLKPDLVGLIEVDQGSYRANGNNQVELLADALGHYHSHSVKYQDQSLWRHVPVLNKQGNAFLARDRIRNETFHYFDSGVKRLVIELELEHVVFYLVHLALGSRVRHQQLSDLHKMVKDTKKPCVVAGDFNALWGKKEIDLFLAASGMYNANQEGLPTYSSKNPRRHLDFILCSDNIVVHKLSVPRVMYSDHLPMVMDFDVEVAVDRRRRDTSARTQFGIREQLRGFGATSVGAGVATKPYGHGGAPSGS